MATVLKYVIRVLQRTTHNVKKSYLLPNICTLPVNKTGRRNMIRIVLPVLLLVLISTAADVNAKFIIWKRETRHNNDLQNMYERTNILTFSRSKRIGWDERVWLADEKTIKRVTEERIVREKVLEDPKHDDVNDRDRWNKIVVAAMSLLIR
ncbi:Reverse transcriptase domain-containing protein [Aphis craccivora]|uniref:Reverse transcriptase domain-containing protein n=1 Tax=Aphis craccivora TaxID=307492 RepID=A0A6G0YSX3_APHCR|nr:Reverse transcriptase domain-containing protein [Aphis craccivora]